MKKVLFATTALVATAGVAAADVTFGGYARFGVLYEDTAAGVSSTDVTSRFRLQIDTTAESDAGVTFGARARINQDNGGSGTGLNGVRFFARTGGLEVGVGNIFGALEFMPGMYPIDLGLTGLGYDYTAYSTGGADAYSSGGAGASQLNGFELMYSMGDLGLHLSASDDNDRVAGHVSYAMGGFTIALAAQDSTLATDTEMAATIGGTVGPADFTLAYADNGTNGDHIVLAARFDVGAATDVEVYVADAESKPDTGYGIDFNHNLGGGTSLRGGVAKRLDGATRADLGVRFNF